MQVEVNGDIESAIRFLKKIVGRDGIHTQIRRRLAFVKPSDIRKEKERIAARRRREVERKREIREHGYNKGLTHSSRLVR